MADADTGERYYSSPEFSQPLVSYAPFRTDFLTTASGLYFVTFKELYIANNSSLFRQLLVQCADDIAGKFTECELVMELPECVTLMTPGSWRWHKEIVKNFAPDAFKKSVVKIDGNTLNRYVIKIPADLTYRMKKFSVKNRYTNQIDLIFLCKTDKKLPRNETVVFFVQAEIEGKQVREKPVKIPLVLLPDINGKMPKTYPLISSMSGYSQLMPRHLDFPEKRAVLLDNIVKAGCNVFSVMGGMAYYNNDIVLHEIRSKGLKIEKVFFPTHYRTPHAQGILPDATEYLEKYPQYKAVCGDGICEGTEAYESCPKDCCGENCDFVEDVSEGKDAGKKEVIKLKKENSLFENIINFFRRLFGK